VRSKKKALIKRVKQQLKDKRGLIADELKKLYQKRSKIHSEAGSTEEVDRLIDEKIYGMSLINEDLARKDKKSSNIEWTDSNYVATARGNGARKAEIVDNNEYNQLLERRQVHSDGPTVLWLQTGALVKCKGRTIPGIVLEIRSTYATVLFGGAEVNTRKLALRPAEWED